MGGIPHAACVFALGRCWLLFMCVQAQAASLSERMRAKRVQHLAAQQKASAVSSAAATPVADSASSVDTASPSAPQTAGPTALDMLTARFRQIMASH